VPRASNTAGLLGRTDISTQGQGSLMRAHTPKPTLATPNVTRRRDEARGSDDRAESKPNLSKTDHDLYLRRGKTGDQSRLIPAPPIRWSRGNMPCRPTPRQHTQPCRTASPPPCQRRDAQASSLSQGCVPRVRSAYFSYTRRRA